MRDDVEVDGVSDDAVREVSIGVRGSARGRCVVVTVVAGERVVTSGEGDGKERRSWRVPSISTSARDAAVDSREIGRGIQIVLHCQTSNAVERD